VKIDGVEYTLRFQVNVIKPSTDGVSSDATAMDIKTQQYKNAIESNNNDNQGNLYKGTRGVSMEEQDSYRGTVSVVGGQTAGGKTISMNTMVTKDAYGFEDRYDGGEYPGLVAHEFLHTMGLDDKGKGVYYSDGGRMEYTGSKQNNFKMQDISNQDISNILKYAKENNGTTNPNDAKVNVSGNAKDEFINSKTVEVTDKKQQ
jgi:hypothetical protein